jgi:hypothetical protein
MENFFEFFMGTPIWTDPEENDPDPQFLEFRACTEGVPGAILGEVLLGDAWYHNQWTHRFCFGCLRKNPDINPEAVTMQAIGWQTDLGWHFRLKCPRCEWESRTYYPGWKPPQRRSPHGGTGHGHLRKRRERTVY